MSYMTYLWKDSLHVAALASVLAKKTDKLSKDTAFLVGLLTHIGKLPLVAFYEHHAGPALVWGQYVEFMETRGDEFRRLILAHWGFPEDMSGLVASTPVGGGLDPSYADLVWAARNVRKLVALEFNASPAALRLGLTQEDVMCLEPDADTVLREMATVFV